ncbi:MAG TPA: hypothetical protein PKD86_07310 [Gemmatales bacterium]|nr:hypothetical protein [Gemmatales bacterium]HMP59144.1 hypothetical protein [Gemmatales bacterium]
MPATFDPVVTTSVEQRASWTTTGAIVAIYGTERITGNPLYVPNPRQFVTIMDADGRPRNGAPVQVTPALAYTAISPKGKWLVGFAHHPPRRTDLSRLSIVDLEQGVQVGTITIGPQEHIVALSFRDEERVWVVSYNGISLWNVVTRQREPSVLDAEPDTPVYFWAATPEHVILEVITTKGVGEEKVQTATKQVHWDLTGREPRREFDLGTSIRGESDIILCEPHGIVIWNRGSREGSVLMGMRLSEGKPVRLFTHASAYSCRMAVSHDKRFLAISTLAGISIYSLPDVISPLLRP